MDTSVVISLIVCGTAVLTCAASAAMILWKGGAQAQRIETAVAQIEEIRTDLKPLARIPVVEQRIGQLEEIVRHMRSDHKELARKVDATTLTAMRAEMASQHDIGD